MPLTAGTRLGPYEIVAPIGKGGMGEVYRARDTKLDRDVAIKVLPEEFADDDERLARFEREAKLLASLNHPNIASIYGFEFSALVLELVEGPTLADRIEQAPIPIDEAIAIAKQMAEALEAGHEAGVVHRDLKPANIKIKEDGTAKVLDYGLAKALEGDAPTRHDSELSQSPTLTRQGTQVGVILGTAAYMSPEQAKGKRVDKRTDVWAFGAVLYEMLAGRRAFDAEDVTDTLAAVLRAEPDLDALPVDTPQTVRALLRACLAKEWKARLRDIGDARLALDGVFGTEGAPRRAESPRTPMRLIAATAVVSALAASAFIWSLLRPEPPRVMRFTTEVDQLVYTAGEGAKITPDGRTLVYVGAQNQVFTRSFDEAEPNVIPGTAGTHQLVMSPDGRWVGVTAGGIFRKVPLEGGGEAPVLDDARPRGFSWGDDGTIVFGTFNSGLWRVPESGGEPEPLTEAAPGRSHNRPSHLPEARGILFNDWAPDDSRIAVLPAGSRRPRTLLEGGGPVFAPTGHLLFQRGSSLWAVPFDLNRLEVSGVPVPVVEGVELSSAGVKRFDVARDGTLIFVPETPASGGVDRIDWVGRDGVVTTVADDAAIYEARVSPNGDRVAMSFSPDSSTRGISVLDLARRSRSRPTNDPASELRWYPDGSRVAYVNSADSSVRSVSVRNDEDAEILHEIQGRGVRPQSWAPDGRTLALDLNGESDIWTLSAGDEPQQILATAASERSPRFSPDGRYLAYVSDESGEDEVFVQSYPDLRDKWTASTSGGTSPEWARDASELFFRSQGNLMVVDVRTDPTFSAGAPRVLLDAQKLAPYRESFDVAPDGKRFLFVEGSSGRTKSLVVILNWTEELKRLVPTDD